MKLTWKEKKCCLFKILVNPDFEIQFPQSLSQILFKDLNVKKP